MIALKVDGTSYTNFLEGGLDIRLDALCNTFSFKMARTEKETLPFKTGMSCEVWVNDTLRLTGTIELLTVRYSSDEHTIEISGRDRTANLLDSNINIINDIEAPIALSEIIRKVISHIGSDLEVVDNAEPPNFTEAQDVAAPEPGDNAFEFIEKYAKQKQVLLTSNGKGNVVITRSNQEQNNNLRIQNTKDATDNNVLNATYSNDNTGRFNLYYIASQLNPVALVTSGKTSLSTIVSQGGQTEDTEINKGRQLVLVSESSYGDSDSINRSLWEANVRKARGRIYEVEVHGYSIEDTLWDINQVVTVQDDFVGISGPMLINTVSNSVSLTTGSITSLMLVDVDSYQLALSEPLEQEDGG